MWPLCGRRQGPLTSWDFNDTVEGAVEHSVRVTARLNRPKTKLITAAVETDKSHGHGWSLKRDRSLQSWTLYQTGSLVHRTKL